MNWLQWRDIKNGENFVGEIYGVKSIPTFIIINREGIIVARDLRDKALQEKIKELLQKE